MNDKAKSDMHKAKPIGPIPHGYDIVDGELSIAGQKASDLLIKAGDSPLFVYSKELLQTRVSHLRAHMPERLSIHYAMKGNPYPPLLEYMNGIVDGFDLASGGEMELAMKAGVKPSDMSFAGPGKRDRELEAAIQHHVTLNLESEGEAHRAIAIADSLGVTPKLAVRVNPSFDLKGSGMKMGGGAKQFGVDADKVPALITYIVDAGAAYEGLHIYAGSQALKAQAIIDMQAATLKLSADISDKANIAPPHINLGGGFGIPYFPGNKPLDIAAVGDGLSHAFAQLPDIISGSEYCVELGRYLVGEAGVYLCKIVDRKISHGETFLVTDGGLHHQLAASGNFGTVIKRNYPVAIASHFGEEPSEVVNIVGCLCTPLDMLSDSAFLPKAEVGDIVAIFCAGAYGASASPANFLGQGAAKEMLI